MSLLAGFVAVIGVGTLLRGFLLVGLMRSLESAPGEGDVADADLPSLTIIAAARDEETEIEEAVRSWLALELPRLQVIVVDDRSGDGTAAVLEKLGAEHPQLIALRVDERRPGWLGKCHALSVAAARAEGEFILFTDADVKLEPRALRGLLARARSDEMDHVSLVPRLHTDGVLQAAMTLLFFQAFLALAGRRLNAEGSGSTIGVGAFNLVRRSLYEKLGGHESIRMQVGDDIALARLLVRAGGRQRIYWGWDVASLRWHAGAWGTIKGIEKNTFWALRLSLVWLLGLSALSLIHLLPLAGPALGPWGWVGFGTWLLGVALPYRVPTVPLSQSAAAVVLHPLSVLLLLAAAWNSALATWRRGGIDWRGDFFSTEEIRAELKPLRWWFGRKGGTP